jgi:CheY-like chemotaxis protein
MSKDEYDIIFMDCQMPEMDGYEATRQIRKGKWHQPRIIAITANVMAGDAEVCRGVGMDDYMSKPVRIEKLCEMLERWLPKGGATVKG